ncbi:MAG: hypothetical protein COV91_05410 [Candidatus Taylorbacteria bacterium CG11_big_fil_rev_8_21_14_0_20_46_11]|uniref:Uncharacterized protein n=1 Tax=Candidatus Taylorbacteria bacterium CG11_big_fil_rev_8_21_14_0_20_46_11 TaxID=1975025 RepID=A0A2H0KAF2_9BACT|nr:MAG: hypothetical protein COV91_05410 [Candidatus Taylorbacteria bacterium CG11_big_fil_rev_8_21_14_0_20_46_11]
MDKRQIFDTVKSGRSVICVKDTGVPGALLEHHCSDYKAVLQQCTTVFCSGIDGHHPTCAACWMVPIKRIKRQALVYIDRMDKKSGCAIVLIQNTSRDRIPGSALALVGSA